MANQSSRRWRSISRDSILWAEWNGEYAVFHRPSGKTHFLNEAGARLIRDILTEPGSVDDAVRALSESDADVPGDPEFRENVARMLVRLEQIGLIEPA